MALTVSAAAARAAVAVAASLGVDCAEPVVLADGANVIVHLRPSPVVAKVAGSTPAVRDAGRWLQRELDVVLFLIGAGAPVMAPSLEVPATVHHRDGHAMTFWAYLEPSGAGPADEATIGSMLRDLHAVLRGYPASPPVLAPLADIPAFLARPQTLLTATDVAVLTENYRRLTEDLALATHPVQVLHGDAGVGNLMAASGQWVWHDFEDTCSGPVAWDLAATTASPRLNRDRILAAYGHPVDTAQLHACERLRRLHLTIWYALYAERLPDCRERAAELLATWRVRQDGLRGGTVRRGSAGAHASSAITARTMRRPCSAMRGKVCR
jgi:Phosphotransferase enzyme family